MSTKFSRFISRTRFGAKKGLWRIFNDHSPNAVPVFVLGAQRSGTTLLLKCLERSMEFDVLGESSHVMIDYRIQSDDVVRNIIKASPHKFVVFKPLTDSHRSNEFLKLAPKTFAIWAFRRVEDRANSSVAKFGSHNLEVLRDIKANKGLNRWQAQALSDETLQFIKSFDYTEMNPESASAIFWYIRNTIFFENGLDKRKDVIPIAYEDLVIDPRAMMRGICRFVGADFSETMVRDVHAKSIGRAESKIPSEIQEFCAPRYEALHQIQKQRWKELNLDG